jgi:multisubunit Na+/H+ antiporter MnhB subunit
LDVSELLTGLQNALPYLKLIACAIGVALLLIALAAAMYVLRAALGPMWQVLLWLFGHTPGERPGELVAGIVFGARMLAWAGLIGVTVWTAVWFLGH